MKKMCIVGNFVADAIKGNPLTRISRRNVAKGIRLHREIDHYTDQSPGFQAEQKPAVAKIPDVFRGHRGHIL